MTTTTPKFLAGATLTSTLATTIYTCPSATTTRIEHLIISNGSTAGAITLSVNNGTNYNVLNAVAITAYGVLELANIVLNAGHTLEAGAGTTTGAVITLFGTETA